MEVIFVIDSYKIKFFGNLILSLTSISARLSKNIIAFTPLCRQLVIYKEDISPINTFQSFDHSILENFYRNYFCDWFLSKEICRISQFWDTIKISSVRISSMKVLHALFIPVIKNTFDNIMVIKMYITYGSIYISFTQKFL